MVHQHLLQGLLVLISAIYIVHSARLMYDASRFHKQCLNRGKAFHSNYTPRGSEYEIGNLTVYESDNRSAKRLLIAVYDIFGFTVNTKEVVDTIAELYDFRVVLPHFYRENYWSDDNWPPEDPEDLERFLRNNASWDNIVKYDIANVMNTFRSRDNITQVGIYGMCWGGNVSVLAATEFDEIKAAGVVHPSGVDNSRADGVRAPTYLLPASNDPDMLPFYEVLLQKFGSNSGHRRFDDMRHAFAGAGGNFSDPLIRMRVNEVIYILGGFFHRNLRN